MRSNTHRYKNYTPLLAIVSVSLLSSCAAAGNIIEPHAWLGLLDLASVGAICVFILRGSSK